MVGDSSRIVIDAADNSAFRIRGLLSKAKCGSPASTRWLKPQPSVLTFGGEASRAVPQLSTGIGTDRRNVIFQIREATKRGSIFDLSSEIAQRTSLVTRQLQRDINTSILDCSTRSELASDLALREIPVLLPLPTPNPPWTEETWSLTNFPANLLIRDSSGNVIHQNFNRTGLNLQRAHGRSQLRHGFSQRYIVSGEQYFSLKSLVMSTACFSCE